MDKPRTRKKLTRRQREQIHSMFDGHCAYCGCEITMQQMQVDHIIPMEFQEFYAAQGQDLDCMDNMYPACRSCNNYKSTLTIEKFRAAIERWTAVLQRDSVTYKNAVRYGLVVPNPQPVKFHFEKVAKE